MAPPFVTLNRVKGLRDSSVASLPQNDKGGEGLTQDDKEGRAQNDGGRKRRGTI